MTEEQTTTQALAEREATELTHPWTGERIELRALGGEELADVLLAARRFDDLNRTFKAAVQKEILRRQDKDANWSQQLGPFKVTGTSPADRVDWQENAPQLYEALCRWEAEGLISAEARDEACVQEVSYKAKVAGIKKLMKRPDLAKRLRRYSRKVEPDRKVSVSRVDEA